MKLLAPVVLLAILVALAIAQRAYYIPRLPPQMAAHIGCTGDVDRWQETTEAVNESARGWLIVSSIAGGIILVNLLAVRFLPDRFINIPNKDYWLATPARRSEATGVMLSFWLWILAGGVAVGVALTQDMIQASFSGHDPGITLPVLAAYFLFLFAQIGLLCVRLLRRREGGGMSRAGPRPLSVSAGQPEHDSETSL